jgi:hypothetical protein
MKHLIVFLLIFYTHAAHADEQNCSISHDKASLTLMGPCDLTDIDHELVETTTKDVPYSLKMEVNCHQDGAELQPDANGKCHVTVNATKPEVVGEVRALFHIHLADLGRLAKNEMARIFFEIKVDSGNAVTAPIRAVKMPQNGENIWYKTNLTKQEKDKDQSQGLRLRVIHFYYDLTSAN